MLIFIVIPPNHKLWLHMDYPVFYYHDGIAFVVKSQFEKSTKSIGAYSLPVYQPEARRALFVACSEKPNFTNSHCKKQVSVCIETGYIALVLIHLLGQQILCKYHHILRWGHRGEVPML